MKRLTLLASLLVTSACVTFTPEQVATFNTEELCSVYARGVVIGRVNEVVAAEVKRRNLECPPEYLVLARQRTLAPAGSGGSHSGYQVPSPAANVSCTPPGNGVNCWTW